MPTVFLTQYLIKPSFIVNLTQSAVTLVRLYSHYCLLMGHSSQQKSVNTSAYCPKVYDLTWRGNSELSSTSVTSATFLLLSVEMSAERRRGSACPRVAQCCTAVIQTAGQSGTVLYSGHTDCRSDSQKVRRRTHTKSMTISQIEFLLHREATQFYTTAVFPRSV